MIIQILSVLLLLSFGPSTYSKSTPPPNKNGMPSSWKTSRLSNEYSVYSLYTQNSNTQTEKEKELVKEREQLYEAYNLLHTLAQDFHKPFDAPAVIVVGHQTSGKSALIEALMGFQFNQVSSNSSESSFI
jgi:ABC-type transport system involved in cytochrome bd biosynthesis fused ATPase/permease subunit